MKRTTGTLQRIRRRGEEGTPGPLIQAPWLERVQGTFNALGKQPGSGGNFTSHITHRFCYFTRYKRCFHVHHEDLWHNHLMQCTAVWHSRAMSNRILWYQNTEISIFPLHL